jgi:hypothetical protein
MELDHRETHTSDSTDEVDGGCSPAVRLCRMLLAVLRPLGEPSAKAGLRIYT